MALFWALLENILYIYSHWIDLSKHLLKKSAEVSKMGFNIFTNGWQTLTDGF